MFGKRHVLALLTFVWATHASASGLSPAAQVQVCKAAIAQVMGRSISIINGSFDGEFVSLNYQRPDDGKRWAYGCQVLQMNRQVLWRSRWDDGSWGRWRNDKADGVLTYQIEGKRIGINDSLIGSNYTWFPFKP